MKIAFRVDASMVIGTGHVMRCLTLANALKDQYDAEALFICRAHQGNLAGLIEKQGHRVICLPAPATTVSVIPLREAPYDSWLAVPWRIDAEETCNAIANAQGIPNWIVIDHYALDEHWESTLRSRFPDVGIMVIDDLANRFHDCDLLLDQNLVAAQEFRYDGLVSRNCKKLLGPTYALLQPAYATLHRMARPRTDTIRRVLIYFGGADHDNATGLALQAWSETSGIDDIHVDVVLPSAGMYTQALREITSGRRNIQLHESLPTLAPLMMAADLSLGASGTTNWERLCLGLPTMVITMADNQIPIALELEARNLIHLLGNINSINVEVFAQEITKIIKTPDLNHWSKTCLATVDGKGTTRVIQELLRLAS